MAHFETTARRARPSGLRWPRIDTNDLWREFKIEQIHRGDCHRRGTRQPGRLRRDSARRCHRRGGPQAGAISREITRKRSKPLTLRRGVIIGLVGERRIATVHGSEGYRARCKPPRFPDGFAGGNLWRVFFPRGPPPLVPRFRSILPLRRRRFKPRAGLADPFRAPVEPLKPPMGQGAEIFPSCPPP